MHQDTLASDVCSRVLARTEEIAIKSTERVLVHQDGTEGSVNWVSFLVERSCRGQGSWHKGHSVEVRVFEQKSVINSREHVLNDGTTG